MNWKKLGKQLLFPHPVIVAVLVPIAAAGLVYSFAVLDGTGLRSIAFYVLSFYALLILCLRMPEFLASFQAFRRKNRYCLRYAADVQWRMNISLFIVCLYNAAYAAFQLALGMHHHSAWFYAMAGYYALLAVLRLMLGRHVRIFKPGEDQRTEWRKYRLCGAGLLMINAALSVFVLYFVRHLRVVRHHEVTVIVMAAYTFGALVLAIANVFRYRRYESPVCSAAKALSLAAAAVSMLSLEDAMLTTFDQGHDPLFQRIMLGASGTAVALLIIGMAIPMIVRATNKLNRSQ